MAFKIGFSAETENKRENKQICLSMSSIAKKPGVFRCKEENVICRI